MKQGKAAAWVSFGFVGVLSACGGAPKPAEAPSAPGAASTARQESSDAAEGAARPTTAAPAAPPMQSLSDKKADRDEPSGPIAQAVSDFERASQSLRSSNDGASDCKNACRSLQSMERAASHLCELTKGTRDAFRCDDATLRVKDERRHVKSSCGACPMGQSLDPNAPLPLP